jgi:hypothetical protein
LEGLVNNTKPSYGGGFARLQISTSLAREDHNGSSSKASNTVMKSIPNSVVGGDEGHFRRYLLAQEMDEPSEEEEVGDDNYSH